MIDVANWNKTFKKYPITVEDKGWVYGVWYCGTSFQKVKLYGQYPPGFLKRALALFPDVAEDRILHCPSGTLTGPGMTVDFHKNEIQIPKVQASADVLPFDDNSFDLILSDPPYSKEDSLKYNCAPFPMRGFMKEARRVGTPNCYLGILHTRYPSYHRSQWALKGLIAVITGFDRATRIFSIFQSTKELS